MLVNHLYKSADFGLLDGHIDLHSLEVDLDVLLSNTHGSQQVRHQKAHIFVQKISKLDHSDLVLVFLAFLYGVVEEVNYNPSLELD